MTNKVHNDVGCGEVSQPIKAVFVAGTDTGVGKTVLASCLATYLLQHGIDACYQKWVSTGGEQAEDLLYGQRMAAVNGEKLAGEVPFNLSLAASPHLAAEQQGGRVDQQVIRDSLAGLQQRHEVVVVEGVGGLMVPLSRELLAIDLVAALGLPVLLVARSGLGTLNHTLLSVEALRRRNIGVIGVVFSDETEVPHELLVSDNMRTIAEIGRVPVLGRIPRIDEPRQLLERFVPIGDAFCRLTGIGG